MKKTIVFINNFNLLTWTKDTIKFINKLPNIDIIIIDNASTYEPLLEYYKKECPYEVVRLKENVGHKAPWKCGIIQKYSPQNAYIVTDPDLDFSNVPLDVLDILWFAIQNYKTPKCGLSIEINDLPKDNPMSDPKISKQPVAEWEKQFWINQLPFDKRYFIAAVDTTFSMYLFPSYYIVPSMRTNRPYTVRHLPWYLTKNNITEEYKYYLSKSETSSSVSTECLRNAFLQKIK